MPSSFLTADVSFPDLSGESSTEEKLNRLSNYLYLLLENLRYTLGNLGEENFNSTELENIGTTITMPVYQSIDRTNQSLTVLGGDVDTLGGNVSGLSETVGALSGQVSSYQQTVSGYTQQVSTFQQTVEGFQSTVSQYQASVEGYASQVSQYTQTVEGFNTTVASYESTLSGYATQVSQYTQTVNGFQSTVANYESTLSGYRSQVSSYQQTVSGFNSTVASYEDTVEGYASQVSSLQQTVNGFTLSASNGSQSSTLSLKSGSTTITSATIKFTGLAEFLTADDLGSGGSTTIYGGRIQTGTLSADAISTGSISSGSGTIGIKGYLKILDSSGGGPYGYLGYVMSYDSSGSTYGVGLKSYQSGTGACLVTDGGARISYGSTYLKQVYVTSDGPTLAYKDSNATYQVRLYAGTLGPVTSGQSYCGNSQHLWAGVYASSGAVSTSDRNRKHAISYDLEGYRALFQALKPCRFKFNDGTSGRYHVGFISQDVEDALAAAGLDSLDFGGFVKDTDGEGEEIYFLRYEEFIALNTAAIQGLEARVRALEGKEQ